MQSACTTKPLVQYQTINLKPLQALLEPIPEPADLSANASEIELLQRAIDGRLGIREANTRFKAIKIQLGDTK